MLSFWFSVSRERRQGALGAVGWVDGWMESQVTLAGVDLVSFMADGGVQSHRLDRGL